MFIIYDIYNIYILKAASPFLPKKTNISDMRWTNGGFTVTHLPSNSKG